MRSDLRPGMQFPDFELPNQDKEVVRLSSLMRGFPTANGWWFVGRPTVEELRMDYRALMSRRPEWWYDKVPPPFVQQQ